MIQERPHTDDVHRKQRFSCLRPCVPNLQINYAVSVAESQETMRTEAALGVHLARLDRRGREAGTHREASLSSPCGSIFIPPC